MRQGRIVVSLMLVLGVVVPLSAVERALIDFTTYNESIDQVVENDKALYTQFAEENPQYDIRNYGWQDFEFEPGDWNLENWKVVLNPSTESVDNNKNSMIKNSPSQQYGNVLGVRIQFSPWENVFWAHIKMPYLLSAYSPNGTFITEDTPGQDNGLAVGVIPNVGQIRFVRSWVYGLNYDYTYGVLISDETEKVSEYGFESINHEGWRRLTWENPHYITDVNDWKFSKKPLYPFSFPYVKFESLVFYKAHGNKDPNFIGYVKDVTVEYDYEIIREDQDIDDEAIWNMFQQRSIDRRITTSKRVAEELMLRRNVEKLKSVNDDATAAQQDQDQDQADAQ